MENIAKEAYEAYADGVGWKDPQGKRLPEWAGLTKDQQSGWCNSAHAVCEFTLANSTAVKVEVDAYIPKRIIG